MIVLKRLFYEIFGDLKSPFFKSLYGIKKGYFHNVSAVAFSDVNNKDEYQDEVYSLANNILFENNCQSVIDFGCGSGYKLFKYFGNLNNTIGIEIEPTLSFLKNKYPTSKWLEFKEDTKLSTDIITISDVIEHVNDPFELPNMIVRNINFEKIIISTPDRSLLKNRSSFGPPNNVSHFREWTYSEFNKFVSGIFNIEYQCISNLEQGTQVIVCVKR
jgi:hypothetical protein